MAEQILIIEDDHGLRETLRQLLELDGYDVVTAADGLEGLERFEAGATDVVVLDLMMPRMDGFGFAAELQRRAGWKSRLTLSCFLTKWPNWLGTLQGLEEAELPPAA